MLLSPFANIKITGLFSVCSQLSTRKKSNFLALFSVSSQLWAFFQRGTESHGENRGRFEVGKQHIFLPTLLYYSLEICCCQDGKMSGKVRLAWKPPYAKDALPMN